MDKHFPVYKPELLGNELRYVTDCIESSWISSLGSYIERFETRFAEFCGVEHAVAVTNGTVALHLALLLFDIGPGDEVIVPDLTFVATANAVRYTGATPVLVDSEPGTWTMDPARIEERITPRTRAILPVHLYGHPADMQAITSLADRHGLIVIEDAAEAHGAECRGRRVGSLGQVGCFSFYGNKVVTTGEGGMLTMHEARLCEKAHFLKDHGMSKELRYWHPAIGYNYRMTNLQAAIGLAQMERVDQILQRKRQIAECYQAGLAGCEALTLQPEAAWAKNIYWMYSILVGDQARLTRDEFMQALKAKGIDSRPFFYPIHQLPPYKQNCSYPVADMLSGRGVNLPSYPGLQDEEIGCICEVIRSVL